MVTTPDLILAGLYGIGCVFLLSCLLVSWYLFIYGIHLRRVLPCGFAGLFLAIGIIGFIAVYIYEYAWILCAVGMAVNVVIMRNFAMLRSIRRSGILPRLVLVLSLLLLITIPVAILFQARHQRQQAVAAAVTAAHHLQERVDRDSAGYATTLTELAALPEFSATLAEKKYGDTLASLQQKVSSPQALTAIADKDGIIQSTSSEFPKGNIFETFAWTTPLMDSTSLHGVARQLDGTPLILAAEPVKEAEEIVGFIFAGTYLTQDYIHMGRDSEAAVALADNRGILFSSSPNARLQSLMTSYDLGYYLKRNHPSAALINSQGTYYVLTTLATSNLDTDQPLTIVASIPLPQTFVNRLP